MSSPVSATLFRAGSAHGEPVAARAREGGVDVRRPGGVIETWTYGSLRRADHAQDVSHTQLETTDRPPAVLVVKDAAFEAALCRFAPHLAPRRRSLWRARLAACTALLLLVAGSGLALYTWALPALAERVVALAPQEWDEALGRQMMRQMAPPQARCRSAAVEQAVQTIAGRLMAARPDAPYRITVAVVDSPETNALAAPGGYIVVYRGLLEQTRSPEELAGVLAHEIQHVLLRHSMKGLMREMFTAVLAAAIFGDVGSAGFAAAAAETLLALGFHRGQEAEADREGLAMLAAARIDPGPLAEFFRRLDEQQANLPRVPAFLSTHPDPGMRRQRLVEAARQAPGGWEPLLAGMAWSAVATGCGER